MQTVLKLTSRILPGNRIEVVAPELPEGADVELFVTLPETVANNQAPLPTKDIRAQAQNYISAIDFLNALPPSTLALQDWERIERGIQEEKNSWA